MGNVIAHRNIYVYWTSIDTRLDYTVYLSYIQTFIEKKHHKKPITPFAFKSKEFTAY